MCVGGVEDERHFLLRCPYYQLERADLASQLDEVYGITWADLTETQRLHTVLLGNGMPRALLEDCHRTTQYSSNPARYNFNNALYCSKDCPILSQCCSTELQYCPA